MHKVRPCIQWSIIGQSSRYRRCVVPAAAIIYVYPKSLIGLLICATSHYTRFPFPSRIHSLPFPGFIWRIENLFIDHVTGLEFDLSHSSICQKECQLLEFVYYASLCNAHNSTLGCVQFAFRRLLKLDCLCLSDLTLFLSLGYIWCRRLISHGKTFGYSRFRHSAGLYLQENAFRSVRYHIRPGMWEKSLLMFYLCTGL